MSNLLPWLSPEQTVEALEILEDCEECLRNTARFGSMRKELRSALERQASTVNEFTSRTRRGVIDGPIVLAIEEIAKKKRMTPGEIIMDALETYISALNRRK